MKNCSTPIPPEQKRLLKVLSCYFNGYVCQTPSTDEYFVNPTSDGYDAMIGELNSIATLIQNNIETLKPILDASGSGDETNLEVNIWTANAQGIVQYSFNDASGNTFDNAVANLIYINDTIYNVGVLKQVQKLNVDDCVERAYQVTPFVDDNNTVYTQATLVERIGCAGCSNLGFIGISLTLPVAEAPFNKCSVLKCV